MDYAELCAALEASLAKELSPERAEHSRRVAALAAELCEREGLDPERGRAAGLAHDLCKEMPKGKQRELASFYPEASPGSALMADKVVHGPAAAALLARHFLVSDEDLLEAVAFHTLGKPGMGELSTIVYCADKLEPGRKQLGETYRSGCLERDLEGMLLSVVEGVIGWMGAQGKAVAPETLILYSTLRQKAAQP
jgi:predicted HD superfamily hydrolase involved in NAD metabolism